jgi:hypothetical protein
MQRQREPSKRRGTAVWKARGSGTRGHGGAPTERCCGTARISMALPWSDHQGRCTAKLSTCVDGWLCMRSCLAGEEGSGAGSNGVFWPHQASILTA